MRPVNRAISRKLVSSIGLSLLGSLLGSSLAPNAHATPKPVAPSAAETRAPAFMLPGVKGETVALDSLDAKIVLVDFWASWCVPCRQSFPWMNAMREKYGDKGLVVIAINLDKDRAAAEKFLAANPASFTIAFDAKGKTAEAYRVAAMPSSFLVGSQGTILLHHQGFDPKKTSELETRIAEECSR